MKRTVLIAVMAIALVMGLVAYAGAATSGKVDVTATVPTALELTIDDADASVTPGTAAFGSLVLDAANTTTVDVGVKANKLWTLAYTASDFQGATPGNNFGVNLMDWNDGATKSGTFANADTIWAAGTGPRGKHTYTYTYQIDGTVHDLYQIEPDTYTSNIVYTLTAP